MIISRTPLRISLGGGGTDIPSYFSQFGGYVISAAINKYNYVTLNKRKFDQRIKANFEHVELVEDAAELKHDIFREALRYANVRDSVEISSISDVPQGSGLGGSGSFTVGLLHALHASKGERLAAEQLAEQACHIEIDILKEPSGKQDQYITALGGIHCLEIGKDGRVSATKPRIAAETLEELERNTLMFYTGMSRKSSEVLQEQHAASQAGKTDVLNCLHRIKEIGGEIKRELELGHVRRFGELMHEHWTVKKTMSSKASNGKIDEWYDVAMRHGALGGKIMGAGNGGFFLFYCEPEKQGAVIAALAAEGIVQTDYALDFGGTQIIVNE